MKTVESDIDRGTLLPIALRTLCPSTLLPFDLYLRRNETDRFILYRERSYPLVQEDLDRLRERGTHTIYILSGDSGVYRDHLREKILNNQEVPPVQRYEVLREAARTLLSEPFTSGKAGAAVTTTSDLGQQMVKTVCDSRVILNDLLGVMTHDYSIFTHAVNVSTYCLLIAYHLGIRDARELMKIAQGALLHDLGKQHVPRAILEKQGGLTEAEKRIVMAHPSWGLRDLCHREDLNWGQLMMVYQHHERCDGRGYPVGVTRTYIHEHARICAIADVCDALMSARPYRKASLHCDVLEYLDRQVGRGFDEEMTSCWIAAIRAET
jgi:HD-GYP domain-containing protein (c-di-GMP phosphodiesterase class II)